jgi:hypothetical protein
MNSNAPWRSWKVLLPLLLLHILPFAMRPALIGGDEPHYALAAHSLAVDGDIDLVNNYREVLEGSSAAGEKHAGDELDQHIRQRFGRTVFVHPIGLPAMLAPLVWLQQKIAPGSAPDILLGGATLTITFLALLAGWSVVRGSAGDARLSAFVVLGIYFSTPLWFYSRTFFTEPYIWSFIVLAIAGIFHSHVVAAGFALGLAFLMKESAALIVVPVMVVAWRRYGFRRASLLSIGTGAAVVVFLVKNKLVYGAALATYQPFVTGSLLEGLVGVVFDLEHGVLWFAPLVFAAAVGWFLPPYRKDSLTSELGLSLVCVAAFYVMTALWADFRGGACYGPRLMVPVLPLFVVPLLRFWRSGGRWPRGAALMAALVGITIQVCAALDPFNAFWSVPISELLLGSWIDRLVGVLVAVVLLWRIAPLDRKRVRE